MTKIQRTLSSSVVKPVKDTIENEETDPVDNESDSNLTITDMRSIKLPTPGCELKFPPIGQARSRR